jgi:hypothetical protein
MRLDPALVSRPICGLPHNTLSWIEIARTTSDKMSFMQS